MPEQDAEEAGWKRFAVSSFSFYHDKALKWGEQKLNIGGWIVNGKICTG